MKVKFRTWYPEGRKMCTPSDSFGGDVFIRSNGELVICGDIGDWKQGLDVSLMEDFLGLIPMMWTGDFDKNGKEIYEGDIVRYEEHDKNGSEYVNEEVVFGGAAFYPIHFHPADTYEVIGNKFQNPELLTKK